MTSGTQLTAGTSWNVETRDLGAAREQHLPLGARAGVGQAYRG